VRDLVNGTVRPESVVFGMGGGVDPAEAEAALIELTGGWVPGPAPRRDARPPTKAAARIPTDGLHTVDVSGFMSWIALGHAMEAIAPEHEAAMAILEEVVNIRLNIATREIRGLTNRAMLSLPAATDGSGVLYLRASGRSESVGPLIRYSVEELARIRRADGAPTAEEMKQAKGGLALGWWQDSLDGARRTAVTYAMESVRRGSLNPLLAWPKAVGAVTAEAVTEAGQRYIDPEVMTAVVVGQIDEVRAARHPRWPTALHEVPPLLRPTEREP
jgi:predicted Zn-dependent peptidase